MPEKGREYVQFKIQEFIYQLKIQGINHLIQTATSHFPNSSAARFWTPNETVQRQQSLEESQPYNITGKFTNCINKNNL